MSKRQTDRHLLSRQTFFNGNASALTRALALAGAVAFSVAFADAPLLAQSIINQSPGSSNRPGAFSTQTVKKIAMRNSSANGSADSFAGYEREQLDLAAPKSAAKRIDGLTNSFPFSFPPDSTNAATSIELLCSDDQGRSWISYDSVRASESRKAFQFDAPAPGEYWFALKTSFKDGKVAFSSTRAYRFEEEPDDFSLGIDDGLEDEENAAPPLLSLNPPRDDALFVEETSAQSEDATQSPKARDESVERKYETPDPNLPRVGKLKTASFAKEARSGKLLVVARWFKADEIEEQYRGAKGKLTIEHGPTPDGPWEPVGTDLSLEENGYSWYATELDMEPFYIRLVVTDENGKSVAEVSDGSLDANHPDVRKALEPVKTPVPFKEIKVEKPKDATDSTKKVGKDDRELENEISLINKTAAEGDEKSKAEADDIERSRNELKTTVDPKSTANVKRRERPFVPAPTNPNQLEINPLFTRGVGVLYRSAQTRHAPDAPSGKKRSIFTPPSQTSRVSSIPPAQQRRSAAQIAAANAKAAREKMEREAKYAREHEMEMFDQKPELMEGRVFYMDENGNMTTTPPASFLQAQNNWQLTDVGEPVAVPDGTPINADGQVINGAPNGQSVAPGMSSETEPPIYMPQNTDDYDASARSGAATLPGNAYRPGEGSSSSPINRRYAPQNQTPNGTSGLPPNTTGAGVAYQSFPQTSYSQSFSPSAIPYNYNATRTSVPANFPPRPSVTR